MKSVISNPSIKGINEYSRVKMRKIKMKERKKRIENGSRGTHGWREVLTLRYWTVGHYGRSPKKRLKLLWGLPARWTISDRYTRTHSGHLPMVLHRTNELPKRHPLPLISTVLNTCDTGTTVTVNIQDWYTPSRKFPMEKYLETHSNGTRNDEY